MTIPHIGALKIVKIVYWMAASIALTAGALAAQAEQINNTAIWVALITGISSLLVSIVVGTFSIVLQTRANKKLDGVLKTEQDKAGAASTRADRAEAHAEGITAEQDRTKGTSDKPVIMKIEEPISVKLEDKKEKKT